MRTNIERVDSIVRQIASERILHIHDNTTAITVVKTTTATCQDASRCFKIDLPALFAAPPPKRGGQTETEDPVPLERRRIAERLDRPRSSIEQARFDLNQAVKLVGDATGPVRVEAWERYQTARDNYTNAVFNAVGVALGRLTHGRFPTALRDRLVEQLRVELHVEYVDQEPPTDPRLSRDGVDGRVTQRL